MKLIRVKKNGKIIVGALDEDGKIKIIDSIDDIYSENIEDLITNKINKIDIKKLETLEGEYKILPSVNKIGKIICVGLNYADHAAESGLTPPTEPFKSTDDFFFEIILFNIKKFLWEWLSTRTCFEKLKIILSTIL